jgi:hypothetical protein
MSEDFLPVAEPEIPEPDLEVLKAGVIDELEGAEFEQAFGAFNAEVDDNADVAFAALSATGDAMVRLAMDQRRQNVAESPPNSNSGVPLDRYTRWFIPGSGPQPWCAFFVSWCLDRVTDSNHRVPWPYPGAVSSIYQWARGSGHLVAKPAHGDIFGLGGEHTGIVAGASADGGTIWTVEGNYENRVSSVSRRSSGLWFVRI